MKNNSSMEISINGHTDNQGSDSYNQKLSEQRAKSVYEYLLKKGINNNKIKYKGYGETVPLTNNDTEENRKKNRRVEIEIIKM